MSDFKLPDYSRYSYGGLIEVKQHLEENDITGAYSCVINEIKNRFPTLNTDYQNTIRQYMFEKSNMTILMNRLYKINYLLVLKHIGWLYFSLALGFLYFAYIKQEYLPESFYIFYFVCSTIYPIFWMLKYRSMNLSYDTALKRFYYKEADLITEFGFDDIEYCETEVAKGLDSIRRYRTHFGTGLGLAMQISLVDDKKIPIPNTIYTKDRVVEHLLNVCGLDKKKI